MTLAGLIGGIAPGSTIEYYRLIVEGFRTRSATNDYPPIIINSINLTKMIGMIAGGQLREVTDYLLGEIGRLDRAGATFGAFCSNTPHIVFDEIRRRSPIPMISIVEATLRAVDGRFEHLGLLGTRFTMEAGFYRDLLGARGIEVVTPDEKDRAWVHDVYMNELVANVFRDETRRGLLDVIGRLRAKHSIDGVILGGTELPLILRPQDAPIPLIDTTRVHVSEIVERLIQ